MWGLLITTILTSAADSLNPVAITQQFVLQGMVKKPKHIWYFIIPTGVTNLIGGFLAYYGLAAFIGNLFGKLVERHGQILFTAELILGIALLTGVGYMLQNNRLQTLEKEIQLLKTSEKKGDGNDEAEVTRKIKSVSPMALVALGVGATLSELTSALPYFAFLTILFNYQLTFFQLVLILVVYNVIYTSPLMILYFIYVRAQEQFDRLYKAIKAQITKWSNILAPTISGLIGVVLIYHSLSLLLK